MYKRDQGYATRVITFVLITLIGFYAAWCWMNHDNPLLRRWGIVGEEASRIICQAGAAVIAVWMTIWGWRVAFRRERSGEFLIDLDGEMRKVVWPAVQPLFDSKTEAWGSTYVVITCTIFFTILIFCLDTVLSVGIQSLLFRRFLFAG